MSYRVQGSLAAEGKETDVLFKFVKKVYGRRDGPQGFCDFVNGVMCQKNLICCEALPCFFWHENLHILVKLHQDDFHCTAPAESLMWLKEELEDEIRLKFSEIVYPGMRYSHLKASYLVTSQGILIVPVLVTSLIFKKQWRCKSVLELQSQSRRCEVVIQRQTDNCWMPKIFRRVVGIARFLRTLRPDIGFAVKELSHRLAVHRVRDFERCKRFCRYLSKTRGLGVFFPRGQGEDPDGFSLVAYSDSEWAGDRNRSCERSKCGGYFEW